MSEFLFIHRLDPEPVQVGLAREQVRKILPGWGLAEHDDQLALIVSELVTNALPHSESQIEVRLSYDGSDLRIEVWDHGADEMPVRRDPDYDDERGRGLQLIDGFIDLYGGMRGIAYHSSHPGKNVYVVLPLRASQ
jgi:anti-sigma regulatory factor (Ser/Thr protein kinase)